MSEVTAVTQSHINTESRETVEDEARRLGVSVRTVYRRRALERRNVIDHGMGDDAPSVTVTGIHKIVDDSSDKAWELLVESLKDTIKRQEREIERQSESINRLESLLCGLQDPTPQDIPSPEHLPLDFAPPKQASVPTLLVIVVTFLVTAAVMSFLYGHK